MVRYSHHSWGSKPWLALFSVTMTQTLSLWKGKPLLPGVGGMARDHSMVLAPLWPLLRPGLLSWWWESRCTQDTEVMFDILGSVCHVRNPKRGLRAQQFQGNAYTPYLDSSDFCGSGGGPTVGELHLGGICIRNRRVTIEDSHRLETTYHPFPFFRWFLLGSYSSVPGYSVMATSIPMPCSFKMPRR